MTNERCPICYNMTLVARQDENENWHGRCTECGFDLDADGVGHCAEEHSMNEDESGVELERDTPLGEELDAGGDAYMAQFDDDPNPYSGTYSEE